MNMHRKLEIIPICMELEELHLQEKDDLVYDKVKKLSKKEKEEDQM